MVNKLSDWKIECCLYCGKKLEPEVWYDTPKQFCNGKCDLKFHEKKHPEFYRCPFCNLYIKKDELLKDL